MNERFTPVRIRAYMQTGIISDQFLPLDGVIYAHIVREKMGDQYVTIPGENTIREGQNIQLPFLKAQMKTDAWFYQCSFAQWPDHMIEDQQTYNKRFDISKSELIDFGKKMGKVEIRRGAYKAYHIKVYYRHALYVDWYAVADKAELERLLPFCTHLGKKTSQGWGSVLKWEVIDWPERWGIRGPGNKIMRSIPAENGAFLYGVRPSYWLPGHQFNCIMPM